MRSCSKLLCKIISRACDLKLIKYSYSAVQNRLHMNHRRMFLPSSHLHIILHLPYFSIAKYLPNLWQRISESRWTGVLLTIPI